VEIRPKAQAEEREREHIARENALVHHRPSRSTEDDESFDEEG
jgi:hypothetical protein